MESPLSFGKSNMLNASKKLPFVSIIIPNFNGKRFLNDCLTSVYQMNYPLSSYEVIIVDNKSTDGSKEYIQKNFPKVKVLALDNNYGFTGASNRGAEVAKGEALAFLNNDGVVDKDWLYCIVQVMVNNPKISLLGSQIILMRDRKSPQYSGGYLNLLGGSVFSSFHGHNPEKNYYFVGSICGAAFTIRKKIFEKIGGFDEDFFMYAEEGDLCMRAWLQGYTVTYVPN
jgi:GT2 family glycosyltransferase